MGEPGKAAMKLISLAKAATYGGKTVTDITIALPAITSPWWIAYIETWSAVYLAIGGATLVTIRIALAIREWRRNK